MKKKGGFAQAVVTQLRLAKYLTLYTIAYLLIIAAGAYGFHELRQEQRERIAFDSKRDYDICEAGNESRVAIKEAFDIYTNALITASEQGDVPESPQEAARRQRNIAAFRALVAEKMKVLDSRDCSEFLDKGE